MQTNYYLAMYDLYANGAKPSTQSIAKDTSQEPKQTVVEFHKSYAKMRAKYTPFKTQDINMNQGKLNMKVFDIFSKHVKTNSDMQAIFYDNEKFMRNNLKKTPPTPLEVIMRNGPFPFHDTIKIKNTHNNGINKLELTLQSKSTNKKYKIAFSHPNVKTVAQLNTFYEEDGMKETAKRYNDSSIYTVWKEQKHLKEQLAQMQNKQKQTKPEEKQYSKEVQNIIAQFKGSEEDRYEKDIKNLIAQILKKEIILHNKMKNPPPDRSIAYEEILNKNYDDDHPLSNSTYDTFTGEMRNTTAQVRVRERKNFKNRYLLGDEFAKTQKFEKKFANYYMDKVRTGVTWESSKVDSIKDLVIDNGLNQAGWIEYIQGRLKTLNEYESGGLFKEQALSVFARAKTLYQDILQDVRNI